MTRLMMLICSVFISCQGRHIGSIDGVEAVGALPIPEFIELSLKKDIVPFPLDSGWVDLVALDTSIEMDIKYATTDNFVGVQLYDCPRCILRQEVAEAIVSVNRALKQEYGYHLKVFDCYRPWSVQKALWEKVPDARYVTPPERGSMHNRGAAVDLTLVGPEGELEMGSPYDFFGEAAYHTFMDHPKEILRNRQILKDVLAEYGFKHIRTEWWHYSFQLKTFEVSDYQWPCE